MSGCCLQRFGHASSDLQTLNKSIKKQIHKWIWTLTLRSGDAVHWAAHAPVIKEQQLSDEGFMSCLMGYSEDRNQQKRGFSVNKYVHFMVIFPPQSRFDSRLTWISTGDEKSREKSRGFIKICEFRRQQRMHFFQLLLGAWERSSPVIFSWNFCYIFFPDRKKYW